jgi:hypothetical protein
LAVRVFVTIFAPTTLPYFENICFKSVARVSVERPETHRLRLWLLAVALVAAVVVVDVAADGPGEGAVIFFFSVVPPDDVPPPLLPAVLVAVPDETSVIPVRSEQKI